MSRSRLWLALAAFVAIAASVAVTAGSGITSSGASDDHYRRGTLKVSPSRLHPDQRFHVKGSGFKPGSEVKILLLLPPEQVGTVDAGKKGSFSARLTLPGNAKSGENEIRALGTAPDGSTLSLTAEIDVQNKHSDKDTSH